MDYVVHPIYTQLSCALVHGRQSFYSGVWVENKNVTDLSFSSRHKRGFYFSTNAVIRQGHLTSSGQCIAYRSGKCQFLAREIASAVISSTFSPAMSTEKVVFSEQYSQNTVEAADIWITELLMWSGSGLESLLDLTCTFHKQEVNLWC